MSTGSTIVDRRAGEGVAVGRRLAGSRPASVKAWLPFSTADSSTPRLYCLPHAGGGASAYRGWIQFLAGEIDVAPLQPPGREMRFREQPHLSTGPMVAELLEVLEEHTSGPYALFGHSMGALVAFELARAVERSGLPKPQHLFVSGRGAPDRAPRGPRLYALPDGALAEELVALDPSSKVLLDAEMRAHFLPSIRADLVLNETYRFQPAPPLSIPITALCGSADPRVPVVDAAGWGDHTTAAFRLQVLPGGHFFLVDQRDALLDILRDTVNRASP